jgi:hypothetical protein
MRGGKRTREKAKFAATEISSLKSMVWTRDALYREAKLCK